MQEGHELIGWGVATGMWDAFMQKAEASAKLSAEGKLEVSTAASDIGTGTWTILTQIGADALGLPLDHVKARIGESTLPASPVEGGSWTAASNGSAVQAACEAVKKTLFKHAKKMANSPLADADFDEIEFKNGRLSRADDPGRGLSITEVMHAADLDEIEESGKVGPDLLQMMKYISYTHSAVFAEVRVDEDLGVVRITRIVCAGGGGSYPQSQDRPQPDSRRRRDGHRNGVA